MAQSHSICGLAVGAAMLVAAPSVGSALPLQGIVQPALGTPSPVAEQVQWRRGWRGGGGGWRRGGRGVGIGAAILGGAILGSALAARPYYSYPRTRYYSYGGDGYDGDVAYCSQRFRSYDPASGTYLGYDGLRHPCP